MKLFKLREYFLSMNIYSRFFFTVLLSLLISIECSAQSSNIPLNPDYYHLIDRFDIKSGGTIHTSYKAYKRSEVARLLDSIDINDGHYSSVDRFNRDYISIDNWEWTREGNEESKKPIWNVFYKSKPDLYHVDSKDFDLHVNPVLHLGVGYDTESDLTTYINSRGVEIRGMINKQVGFYSYLVENQMINPGYVRNFTSEFGVVPHEGFWKNFKDNGVDFFTARGYISFEAAKFINFQFGHDRFKIGDGFRSMLLSDFGNNYLFLKINTQVWKIRYTNLFTKVNADAFGAGGVSPGDDFPDKYVTSHHLSIDVTPNLNIGLFEAVIFGAEDDFGNSSFNLAYLNPIIFYRAVEQNEGSDDNAMVGMDFKWNIKKRYQLYGQFIFDEFKLDELTSGTGWWANKFSGQFGVKYLDALGIQNLDLQGEVNISRPYTYSHNNLFTNYSHYRQPLAHPFGANFKEFVGVARYQPMDRLTFVGKIILATYGTDSIDSNFGKNILLDNTTRTNGTPDPDFGNEIGQGIGNDLLFLDLTISYQLKHNLFLDLQQTFRQLDNELSGEATTSYTAFSFRWNIPKRIHDF